MSRVMEYLPTFKKAFYTARDKTELFFRNFGHVIQGIFRLFRYNLKEILGFLLVCNGFTVVATMVWKNILLDILMKINGKTYIGPVNMRQIFLNPWSILIMLFFAVCIMLINFFEIAGLMHAFAMSRIGKNTSVVSMFLIGFRTCKKCLHPKNWLLMVFVMVLLPMAKFLPLTGTTMKLVFPGFVNQTIDYTTSLKIIYRVGYILILSFLAVYVFAINSFVLHRKKDFFQSCKQSRQIEKGHIVETILTFVLLTALMNLVINSISSMLMVNAEEIKTLFKGDLGIFSKSEALGMNIYVVRQILKSYIAPAINNAALTVLYFRYVEERKMTATISKSIFIEKKLKLRTNIIVWSLVAAFFAGSIGYLCFKYSFLAEDVGPVLVCAHRGDNVNAPENTMPAFELAASENLEWIETDVWQTSDGVIVCNHDASIARTTGDKLYIYNMTYEELIKHEFSSSLPGNYEHVVVPTLEEVLTFAKENNMHVQVELKGDSNDIGFEENVLDVIDRTGMHDNVMVISQNARRIMRVNDLDPTIKKAYCMFFAYGNLEDIEYTDNVSIEESNVTPELVHHLHEQGIEVFCWTVDLDDTVQYLVSCDVDVIGTDNPLLISSAVDRADYSGGLPRVFHIVMHVVAGMDK